MTPARFEGGVVEADFCEKVLGVSLQMKVLMPLATSVAMPNLVRVKAKNLMPLVTLQRTRMIPLQLLGLAKMLRVVQSQWKNLLPVTICVTML